MMKKFYVLFIWLLASAACSFAQKKPNILWITIEDTSPRFIGIYGNKHAKTPVIDQLAQQGIRFNNAFSTGSVCSPSRTCLITGVKTYETGTGNHRSNYALPSFIHGFPHYLKEAGYHTSNNSKTDYNVSNNKAFIADAWDESSAKAGWWNRKPGQPFFAVVNYNDSHQSRTMTDSYAKYTEEVLNELPDAEQIADDAFEMPSIYRDSPEMRKQFARVYNSIKLTDNKIGELLQHLQDDKLRDSTIIFLFADHGEGIPRGKTNGIDLGYRVPFVIWFPPMYAHLSPWGKSGAVTEELIDFHDLAPTLISLAGGKVPDYMKGRNLIGPNRTLPADHLVLSSDRSDNGIDMVRSVTDGRYIYSRNFMPFMPELRYIRYMEIAEMKQQMRKDLAENQLNDFQKQLFQDRPAEFLYDTQSDIWETKNLIGDPKHRVIADKMRGLLSKEMLAARDIMLLPEYEIAAISKTTTPYEFRKSDTNFNVKAILNAALLSGKRGKDIAAQQVKLLANENKTVRYWAALGLRSQNAEVLKPHQRALTASLQDAYAPVAVTSAAIAYDVFKDQAAAEILKKHCNVDNAEIALMAINYLLYIQEKTPFIETIKSVQQATNRYDDEYKSATYKVKAACLDFLAILSLVPNNATAGD
ncbi:sulfatase [Dyadobacter sp. CY326]|uniref:sulfatase family protein n=1 Tax=Dyadobacter sp. CY326 TaxID=2907300 RepID=UPI001F1E0619|nr:sulfatase [Dyadobacter sp. CY326]MCE7066622.1 sulfatase [Dyadobacter sp. CY326]